MGYLNLFPLCFIVTTYFLWYTFNQIDDAVSETFKNIFLIGEAYEKEHREHQKNIYFYIEPIDCDV